ncbi:RNA polymerase sigma factor FliA [Variovorax ginsengisoli]|uniref:RNA polymerase sigma factor FliA n=1 Tax=Variovorax ginsengisoli TaxID=363844 RepID=A0ABT9SD83_9BURK|nr:RNA polymerase sigma factor FliA [Variovorax ginsengisoli]MDP9902323.1 RNA polymerase sigma factor for flagellar operon FliA [Variovorax ginsengisoli]
MYTAQGNIEKSHLLKQHQPMVRRIALQMMSRLPASVELDDLIQAGMLGLLDASNRYEDNRGAKFETFAGQRIRGAMLDELRANDWGSRGLRQSARRVEKAVQALEHRHGRAPSEAEIAQELALDLESYRSLLQEIRGCQLLYVEDFSKDDSENAFLDLFAKEARMDRYGGSDPEEQLLESDLRQQLVAAIKALPERDQLLMSLYYEQELNLREIGAILEVSQSRVCQLHAQAISRLRARLRP